jgi:hypothetical protein
LAKGLEHPDQIYTEKLLVPVMEIKTIFMALARRKSRGGFSCGRSNSYQGRASYNLKGRGGYVQLFDSLIPDSPMTSETSSFVTNKIADKLRFFRSDWSKI